MKYKPFSNHTELVARAARYREAFRAISSGDSYMHIKGNLYDDYKEYLELNGVKDIKAMVSLDSIYVADEYHILVMANSSNKFTNRELLMIYNDSMVHFHITYYGDYNEDNAFDMAYAALFPDTNNGNAEYFIGYKEYGMIAAVDCIVAAVLAGNVCSAVAGGSVVEKGLHGRFQPYMADIIIEHFDELYNMIIYPGFNIMNIIETLGVSTIRMYFGK
jgi:hypothetical protein